MYAADIATMQLKAERVKGPGAALAAALDRPRLAFVAAILRCMKKKIEIFLKKIFMKKKLKNFAFVAAILRCKIYMGRMGTFKEHMMTYMGYMRTYVGHMMTYMGYMRSFLGHMMTYMGY